MPAFPIGQSAYRRGTDLFPEVRLENLFVEQTPTNQVEGVALLMRPALAGYGDLGTGPIRALHWEDDVFGDASLVVSGTQLFSIGADGSGALLLGALPGTELCEIASDASRALIATTGDLYQTNGVTVTAVTFPDSQDVVSVGYLNGYFLAVPFGSKRIYYTDLITGNFTGTRFISAERHTDRVLRIVVTSDEIWALGSSSTEVFVPTGADTADQPPFQRVAGRLYERGCRNGRTAVGADNTVIWVGDDGIVYRGDAVPLRISTNGIEDRISHADALVLSAWAFSMDGHSFYVLHLGAVGTFVLDLLTGGWSEWTSYGRAKWRAIVGATLAEGLVIAGDDQTSAIYKLNPLGVADLDGAAIVRAFTAGVPITGTKPVCTSVSLDCAVGLSAPGADAKITMRYSDTQGQTWQSAGAQSLGKQGEYDRRVRWTRLGQMKPPVRVFEFSVSDPVRTRFSTARMNDPY